ncbi:MAG: hypothetical protein IKZ53_10615 [Selenomonadaceae bacterium]|nr:hypothetical protein [Selenomonadaceae bacterium]
MIINFMRKIFAVMSALAILCSLNCAAAKKSVAVMPLENVSGYDEEKVAEIMTEQLIVAIHSVGTYTVVERTQMGAILREQGFQNIAVDPDKAVELGKLSGADYTLVGKVTMAFIEQNPTATAISTIGSALGLGGISETAGGFVNKFKGRIGLEYRLVDNKTGEIITAKIVEGNKSGSSVASAFHNACKNAADNFLKDLDNINPFRARIAEIDGSNIYIDKGSESGLRPGEILIVVRETEPVIVNGKVVAMKQSEVGKIKVVEVSSDYAVCKTDGFFDDVKKGDIVKRS